MPIRMRCSTAANVRKASISIRLFSMRRALRTRLRAADVDCMGLASQRVRFTNGGFMNPWRLSAIACATSLIFAAPLFAQSQTGTSSSATTSSPPAASATAPAPAPASSCAGLTGTARADCENAQNASNALCFGMSGAVRSDCEKSYYPNQGRAQAAPAKPDSGASGSDSSGASGASSSGTSGASGSSSGSSSGSPK